MTDLHLALLGDSGAGKTIFCQLLDSGRFSKVVCASIGTEVYTYNVDGSDRKINLYDIACNRAYVKYMAPYLKRADAVLIFHDATKENHEVNWHAHLRQYNKAAKVFHVRVKVDCPNGIYTHSACAGISLGDLALSQNPDLGTLLREIVRYCKKPPVTNWLQRIGFRGFNSGGLLLNRES